MPLQLNEKLPWSVITGTLGSCITPPPFAFDLSLKALCHSFTIRREATEEGLFTIGGVGLYNFLGSLWCHLPTFKMLPTALNPCICNGYICCICNGYICCIFQYAAFKSHWHLCIIKASEVGWAKDILNQCK